MKSSLKTFLAVAEPLAVFASGALLFRAILKLADPSGELAQGPAIPLMRVATILAIAWITDTLFRKRKLQDWGLHLTDQSSIATLADAARMLVLGGAAPILITLFSKNGMTMPDWSNLPVPVLSQEVFLTGYALTRFSDQLPKKWVTMAIVLLFMAAHLNHRADGVEGILFIAVMGLQGYCWSAYRFAKGSLLPLMLAHLALLTLYSFPVPALVLFATILILPGNRKWFAETFRVSPAIK